MKKNNSNIQNGLVDNKSCEKLDFWEYEDKDIIVSFPDKNLWIPTNKKTVLGAFLKEFNDNIEQRNKIKKSTDSLPIPYFISFGVTMLLAFLCGSFIYHAYSKRMLLLDPFFLLFGFFASLGLALTSIVGIFNWKKT